MKKAKIGVIAASTTVLDAGTYCCAQVIIKNGSVELMICWKANIFHDLKSMGIAMSRNRRTASRNSAAISEREQIKVIGGIDLEPDLGQRIGRAPGAGERQQHKIVTPGRDEQGRSRYPAPAAAPPHPRRLSCAPANCLPGMFVNWA